MIHETVLWKTDAQSRLCTRRSEMRQPAGARGGTGLAPRRAAGYDESVQSVGRVMGTFHTSCRVENVVDRAKTATVAKLLVDTGSEFTWLPERTLVKIAVREEKKDVAFVMANGQHVTRNVGFAVIRIGKHFTIDEVVFAQKGDLSLLGARTLEGLNLTVDAANKRLVAAGPLPAAGSN
jgi:predicted aspartyl protease